VQRRPLPDKPAELARFGAVVFALAVAVELLIESRRAAGALAAWICRTTPTPAGPQVCEGAFVLRWMTGHLPVYVLATGVAAVVATAVSLAIRGFSWPGVARAAAVVVGLLALSELVACAGDATCGLSVNCT